MKRDIIHSSKRGTWAPHCESNFEIILNFALRLTHKAVKGASSFAQRIFPSGIDGKTIVKK